MNIILSIKPKYVKAIFSGEKVFEYRKVIPRQPISQVIIYASAPISKIVGTFEVGDVIKEDTFDLLWQKTSHGAGISKEDLSNYFATKNVMFAFPIKNVQEYAQPQALEGTPPQSFCYHPALL